MMDAPFGSWGTQTFIPGLTADAMVAPWVIKAAMDGPACAACVKKVLVPELEPGTVVILDNLTTHKNAEATKAMRDAGCRFLFLPPYSPGLNPIEMAFSKLKARPRLIGARTFMDMFDVIAQICDLYSPQECCSYFKAAGYVSVKSRMIKFLTSARPSCTWCFVKLNSAQKNVRYSNREAESALVALNIGKTVLMAILVRYRQAEIEIECS